MPIKLEVPLGSGNISNFSGSSTDNAIVRWDGVTGALIQDSDLIVTDGGVLDYKTSGTLNIGTVNATTINLGKTGATVNIVGSTVNIGEAGATVNILGSVNHTQATNLQVTDSLITINKGGAAASAIGAGVEFEEDGSAAGYVKTSSDRNSINIKAPNSNGIVSITPGASDFSIDNTVVKSSESSTTDNVIVRMDATTGKLIQDSGVVINDTNDISGVGALTMTGTLGVTGDITVTGNVDGVDVSALSSSVSSHTGASTGVHGVTGNVVGSSDTQTLSNKKLVDSSTTIIDDGDNTKAAKFEVGGISPSTTRTVTIPDADVNLGSLTNSNISSSAAIDASKIANGNVSNTEFQYLDGVTSAIQTQLGNKQPLDATLTALAAYNTNGILTQTASDTFAGRTITGTSNQITMTNGDGVSGNPTVAIASNPVLPGTDCMIPPKGTTAQRVSTTDGGFRFNIDLNRWEGYKSSAWGEIGGGGASESIIKLYRAFSDSTTDFTVKSINDIMPDPQGADTFDGTWEVMSSGGNALLSNNDANNVYHIGTDADSQYGAVGVAVSIPAYIRGKNIVAQFNYRTKDDSGDSTNSDWRFWIWDATNGFNTTTSSSGAKAAGTTITVADHSGRTLSVGQKIWVGETGGTAAVTESYLTSVTDNGTTWDIQLSTAVTLTSGDRFITGILNDVLTAAIDEADSDSNLIGEVKKIYFPTLETTASVVLMWQQMTAQTDAHLYFDNILLSSDVLKSVPTQLESEYGMWEDFAGNYNTYHPYFTNTYDNTISKTGTVYNDSSNGWKFVASRKVRVSATLFFSSDAGANDYWGIVKNAAVGTTFTSQTDKNKLTFSYSSSTDHTDNATANIILETGDSISIVTNGHTPTAFEADSRIHLVVTPLQNQSILVESVDSVISGWTSYTPTFGAGLGTPTGISAYWRRVGNEMEVRGSFTTGTVTTAVASITLPSGYFLDSTFIGLSNTTSAVGQKLGEWTADTASQWGSILSATGTATDRVYISRGGSGANPLIPTVSCSTDSISSNTDPVSFYFKVPIAGWSSYPKPVLAFPTVSYGQNAESYFAHTHAGYGSTNTKIPYYSTTVHNSISLLGTITNDSTNGWSVTATKRCKITLTTTFSATAATNWGISKNSAQLTTNFASITEADRVQVDRIDAANDEKVCSYVGILNPRDVIRVHTAASTASAASSHRINVLLEPCEEVINQAAIIAQPVAIIKNKLDEDTYEGTFTGNTITTRSLNTLEGSIAEVGVTLSANAFTLPSGAFTIEWDAVAVGVNRHVSQLYNNTDTTVMKVGTAAYAISGARNHSTSPGIWSGTLTKSTTFYIKHICQTTNVAEGLGIAPDDGNVSNYATFAGSDDYNVGTVVKITRHR